MDMIVTGRPVTAQEAFHMGLANRVVPHGTALEESLKVARNLLEFPHRCMNADRLNAYYAAFDAQTTEDALHHELKQGIEVVATESISGATNFIKGAGRHGLLVGSRSKL